MAFTITYTQSSMFSLPLLARGGRCPGRTWLWNERHPWAALHPGLNKNELLLCGTSNTLELFIILVSLSWLIHTPLDKMRWILILHSDLEGPEGRGGVDTWFNMKARATCTLSWVLDSFWGCCWHERGHIRRQTLFFNGLSIDFYDPFPSRT